MNSQNVYIAALPRSGSTLLGMMLGAHSSIAHIGESAYWTALDVSKVRCCCGTVGCSVLQSVYTRLRSCWQETLDVRRVCGVIDKLDEPSKSRHSLSHQADVGNAEDIRQVLERGTLGLTRIAEESRLLFRKPIIVENSKYIRIARALLEGKTNWKVIILTRDPRGVALSSLLSGKRKGIPRPVHEKVSLMDAFARQVRELKDYAEVLHVRYEELCRSPKQVLGGICSFLGVEYQDEMLCFKRHKGHLLMGNHMMLDDNELVREDLRWKKELSGSDLVSLLQPGLVEAYADLGYALTPD